MTKKEIEDYIKDNVKNLPYLSSGLYDTPYLFVFNKSNHSVSLYHINLNSHHGTYYSSRNSNYRVDFSITYVKGVSSTFIADVGFLFPKFSGDNTGSSYGCPVYIDVPLNPSLVTFTNFTPSSSYDFEYRLTYNGIVDNGWFVTSSDSDHSFDVDVSKSVLLGTSKIIYNNFYTFTEAFEYCKSQYLEYHSSANFLNYKKFLSTYLVCLASSKDRCCLEYC